METIEGTIETISRAFNGGWRFASVHPHGTVTGYLPNLNPGDLCVFQGTWKSHPKYGKQFAVDHVRVGTPRDVRGIQSYLARHYNWIGPVTAKALVATFGEKLFDVMETEPDRLATVPGITSARAREIHDTCLAIKKDQEHDVFFSTHGVTLALSAKFVGEYGSKEAAIEQVKRNPYKLADDLWGVGFKKADAIALSLGIKRDSSYRLSAGLKWTLEASANGEGHSYLPRDELAIRAAQVLMVKKDSDSLNEALSKFQERADIVVVKDRIYKRDLYDAEQVVAYKLLVLAGIPFCHTLQNSAPELVADTDPDQQRAIELALTSKILVITGGPGVGKTYTVNRIIKALGMNESEVLLAAPTGKAAKRMSELSGGWPATTIHRLLEYSPFPDGFARDHDNPLTCKTLIIDEASMLDIRLAAALFDAINPNETQVVFVGDVDQLPSVGPGRVLQDMIDSGRIPTARLRTLHRVAAESLINVNAQAINRGEKIRLNDPTSDFVFMEADEPEQIRELILNAVTKISENLGHHRDDIQVLCPQKRGVIGTIEMGPALRPLLNPGGSAIKGTPFQVGDRVIQLRNNYRLGVFNGEIGRVLRDAVDNLTIDFDDRTIPYPKASLDELGLAYALTIHKAQGSEFPVVIIPIHTTNFMMLKRNLIYTGITRGKGLVLLVGSRKAVNMAIKTIDSGNRHSGLEELISRDKQG